MAASLTVRSPGTPAAAGPPSLLELEYQVQSRVGNLVREVRLLRIDAGLVLRGQSRTYYGKQLAQAALLDATVEQLAANEIDVV